LRWGNLIQYYAQTRLYFSIFVEAIQSSITFLLNEYRFFLGVDFNEERFLRDLVDFDKTAF
ncbi:hypothetical protein T12_12645, partial [Trichinella patagoniensis]